MTTAFRPMDARDRKFVIDSWVKSYRTSDYAGLIQMRDWFDVMLPQIDRLIGRPGIAVTIAYDPAETDRIADINGWICVESARDVPIVYYVFVKGPYRSRRDELGRRVGGGIARGLFAAAGVELERPFVFACKTYVVDDLEKSHELQRLAPYASFKPLAGRH